MNRFRSIGLAAVLSIAAAVAMPAQTYGGPYAPQYDQRGAYTDGGYYRGNDQGGYYNRGTYDQRSYDQRNYDQRNYDQRAYHRRDRDYQDERGYSGYRSYDHERTERSVAIVGGGAAAGAAIGGLSGGGRGAAVGALIGGAGGFLYDHFAQRHRDRD